jgi:hypothetical protein
VPSRITLLSARMPVLNNKVLSRIGIPPHYMWGLFSEARSAPFPNLVHAHFLWRSFRVTRAYHLPPSVIRSRETLNTKPAPGKHRKVASLSQATNILICALHRWWSSWFLLFFLYFLTLKFGLKTPPEKKMTPPSPSGTQFLLQQLQFSS